MIPTQENSPHGVREWIWPVLVALAIFAASTQSRVAAPHIINVDKIGHFLVYGLLGTLLARVPTIARLKPLGIYSAVLIASLYGITDEFHQSFTPGRDVEVADWIMDTSGAWLAVALYAHWSTYRRLLERRIGSMGNENAGPAATGT